MFGIHPPAFVVSPGMTEMVLSARSTLNVLKADTLPRSTNSVTYLQQAGRQKHKNRHTQKGMTTLNSKQHRKVEVQRDRATVETGQSDGNTGGPETRLLRGNQIFRAFHMDRNQRKGNSATDFGILKPVFQTFLAISHLIDNSSNLESESAVFKLPESKQKPSVCLFCSTQTISLLSPKTSKASYWSEI